MSVERVVHPTIWCHMAFQTYDWNVFGCNMTPNPNFRGELCAQLPSISALKCLRHRSDLLKLLAFQKQLAALRSPEQLELQDYKIMGELQVHGVTAYNSATV